MTAAQSLTTDRQVVATAGTRVQLATAYSKVSAVAIQAETDNTGIIVVGGPDVVAAQATRKGIALNAGETLSVEVNQLEDVWLDSTVSGDGVTFIAEAP